MKNANSQQELFSFNTQKYHLTLQGNSKAMGIYYRLSHRFRNKVFTKKIKDNKNFIYSNCNKEPIIQLVFFIDF